MADAVQTFRAISWLVFKWLLIGLAGLIALIAVCVGGYFGWQWYFHGRHVNNIEAVARIDGDLCKRPDYPVFVGFSNKSGRTIDHVSFTLQAKVPGRSSNIADYHSYSSDTVIKPSEGFGHCYKLPKLSELVLDLKSLDWSLRYVTYTFAE